MVYVVDVAILGLCLFISTFSQFCREQFPDYLTTISTWNEKPTPNFGFLEQQEYLEKLLPSVKELRQLNLQ